MCLVPLTSLISVLVGSSRSHPFIYLFPAQFPEAPHPVCRHPFFCNPPIDCVALDPKVGRDLVYGEPSVFHHCSGHIREPRLALSASGSGTAPLDWHIIA